LNRSLLALDPAPTPQPDRMLRSVANVVKRRCVSRARWSYDTRHGAEDDNLR